MKMKASISSLCFGLITFETYSSESLSNVEEYIVKKGDTFSKIVKSFLPYDEAISFTSSGYLNARNRFQRINSHIKNFEQIFPSQKVYIPAEYSRSGRDFFVKYKIKNGESLNKIVKSYYQEDLRGYAVSYLIDVNSFQLKNPSFIRYGDYLRLPKPIYLRKTTLVSSMGRDIASLSFFEKERKFLKHEILNLSDKEIDEFLVCLKGIAFSRSRKDLINALYFTVGIARKLQKKEIGREVVSLLKYSLREGRGHKDSIIRFFKYWKEVRGQLKKRART